MEGVFLRDVQKADPHRAEGLRFGAGPLVGFAAAVLDIPQHRPAQIGQMGPDLMGPPGDQADSAQRIGPGGAQHVHVGDDLLAAAGLVGVGVDADLVGLLVMLPPGGEAAPRRDAHHDGVVFLFQPVGADDLVHVPQGGVVLGRDDQPLGAAVQPVAEGGDKAVFPAGDVFPLFGQVGGEGVHQIGVAGAVAVAEQVGGFVEDGDVLILVDHLHPGLSGLCGPGRAGRLCLGREKLVVDVQLDQVPGRKAGVGGGLFAVDLDPLVAKALV